MACVDDNLLAAFADGTLSDEEREAVEEHIDRCDVCRRALSALATGLAAGDGDLGVVDEDPVVIPSTGPRDPTGDWPAFLGLDTERFQVKRYLGSGGMGRVYEAIDSHSGALVALKTLKSLSGTTLYRFKKEFRSLAGLRHPNLVTLYELVQEKHQWFFTMELVDGQDFVTWARDAPEEVEADSGGVRWDRLREALFQLGEGLGVLHDAGKVHRDIKPSNVMVTAEGRLVILDFGLVTEIVPDSQQTDLGLIGTVPYMAPEQAAEKPATAASDWYAVGTMVYEALTGGRPFRGPAMKVLLDKQHEAPRSPAELDPTVDPDLNDLCMELLRSDPAERPDGAMVLERLSRARPDLHLPGESSMPGTFEPEHFVGRGDELQQLLRACDAVRTHHGLSVTVVTGPSGIGKTALVERFLAECRRQEVERPLVFRGRCYERETVPYKAFDALVDDLTRYLVRLPTDRLLLVLPPEATYLSDVFPVLQRIGALQDARYLITTIPDPNERRRRAFAALKDLLAGLTRLHPVVISLDDLQWADDDSLALLRAIAGTATMGRLLVILAVRNEDAARLDALSDCLEEASGLGRVTTLALGPLSDQESHQLLARLLESTPSAGGGLSDNGSLVREAGGNPFFLQELVRFVGSHQRQSHPDAIDPDTTPLEAVIAERLAALPDLPRRLLDLIAVAGDAIPKTLLARAAGVDRVSGAWPAALQTLRAERLVRDQGPRDVDPVTTSHDKIREEVTVLLEDGARRETHRRLAEATEELRGDDVDLLARHWAAAGDARRGLDYVIRAADAARDKLAFDHAARLYHTALEMVDDSSLLVTLGRSLGDALASAGWPGRAAEAYLGAARHADRGTRIVLRRMATKQLLTGGYMARGREAIHGVLQEAGLRLPETSGQAFRSLVFHRAWLRLRGLGFREREPDEIPPSAHARMDILFTVAEGLFNTDLIRAVDFQARFLLETLRQGDIRRISMALSREAVGMVAVDTKKIPRGRELIGQAELLARRAGDDAVIATCVAIKACIEFYAGSWQACLRGTEEAERILETRCHGVQFEKASNRWFLLFALLRRGQLKDLSERLRRFAAESQRLGDRYAAVMHRATCNILWLARDEVDQARQDLRGLLDTWPEDSYMSPHYLCALARAEQHLYLGEGEAAWQEMVAAAPLVTKSLLIKNSLVRTMLHRRLGQAALVLAGQGTTHEHHRTYLRHALRYARLLHRERLPYTTAWAALIEAGAHWQEGRLPRARLLDLLTMAIGLLEVADCQAIAAAARRQKGLIVGGAEGEKLIRKADRWLENEGVVNPRKFANLLAPGFSTSPGPRRVAT